MNWDDLKIFLAVARTGTFSAAAQQLNIQHSTVSRRIKALEAYLGSIIVRRIKGRYQLTLAGEKLKQAALNIESHVVQVDGALLNTQEPLAGRLRISTIDTFAAHFLMPILALFKQKHPEIDLHIATSNRPVSLTNRDADVALRLTNEPTESLIGVRAATIASAVYGSRKYLHTLSEQAQQPQWIGVSCCDYHRNWTRESSNTSEHNLNCDDALITLAAIKNGLGVSFLPCHIGDQDPSLKRLYPPNPKHDLGLWVLIHPEQRNNARITTFKAFIVKAIKERAGILDASAY